MKAKGRKWMSFLILVCLYGGLAHAQENWVYIYDNPAYDNVDLFRDIRRSPYDGYIYACGRAYRSSSYTRLCLTKLNPATGDTVWHRRFDPPGTDEYGDGYELDFDAAGNIYIAGGVQLNNGYDFAIVKYTPAGVMTHYNLYHIGSLSYTDYALSVDIGPDNMVYVAGYTKDSDQETEFIVRKYDTTLVYTGRQYWVDYNGLNMKAYRVRVDNNLNVWACGTMRYVSNCQKFTVVKLDTHMTEQAKFQAGQYVSSSSQVALDLCLPWGGGEGVYACGKIFNFGGTGYDFFAVKVDANCNEEWSATIANSDTEEAYRIISGPSGATYVAGYTRIGSGQAENYTVVCYSGSIEAWKYVKNGTQNSNDRARDLDLDPSGTYCYSAGYLKNTGHDYDYWVVKHSPMDSLPIWEYTYNGPATEDDKIYSIDVSNDGNLYVAGNIELDASKYEAGVISLPQNFPPSVPELISPVNSGFENDTASITFIWHASTDDPEGDSIAGYYIGYGVDPGFIVYDSVWVASPGTTYTGGLSDTVYYWAVKVHDSQGGQSHWAGVWSFRFDLTAPIAPVLTSPVAGEYEQDTSVFFDWGVVTFMETPSPVTYVIQVDTNTGFPVPIIDTTDVDSITFELPGEDVYYWHVKAYDAAGNSGPYSDAESFRLDISPPLINLTDQLENTISGGPFTINTQVTDFYGVDSVLLYYWRVMTEYTWYSVKMTAAADDWYQGVIPETIENNDTTKYYIWAIDNATWETLDPEDAPIDYYSFIANDLGIEELDTPASFSFGLKGNPAKGKAMFSMSLPEDGLITLRIYDVTGRLIDKPVSGTMTAGTYEISWTSKATAGVYFYKLESPWKTEIGKLVIVR